MRVTAAKDGVQGRRRLRIFAAAAALVLLCAVCVGGVSGADVWTGSVDTTWAGYGTQADPYLITSAAELAGLAQKVNGGETYSGDYFKLTTDIDLAGKQWAPIGSSSSNSFNGIFDGQWNRISNYEAYDVGKVCGLFGYVSGTIKNLVVSDVKISIDQGNVDSGSIVGRLLSGGRVEQCTVLGSVSAVGNNSGTLGGMIGHMDNGSYLEGWSVEDISLPQVKERGVVVGNNPNLGASDGKIEDKRVAYIINVYEIDLIGDFPDELESNVLLTTTTLYSTEGSTVRAVYTLEDGYYVDESMSTLSGTIPKTGTLTLNVYIREIAYLITIPDSVHISDSKYESMTISAERLWIPKSSSVRVTVSGEHKSTDSEFNLAYSTDSQILLPYTLSVGGVSISNGGVVKGFTTADSAAERLTATVNGEPIYAGTYKDSLTFTLQYIETRQAA